jgi:hypothetical protein
MEGIAGEGNRLVSALRIATYSELSFIPTALPSMRESDTWGCTSGGMALPGCSFQIENNCRTGSSPGSAFSWQPDQRPLVIWLTQGSAAGGQDAAVDNKGDRQHATGRADGRTQLKNGISIQPKIQEEVEQATDQAGAPQHLRRSHDVRGQGHKAPATGTGGGRTREEKRPLPNVSRASQGSSRRRSCPNPVMPGNIIQPPPNNKAAAPPA